MPKLILGSGSPRRLDLLAQLGLTPDAVRPPDIDEDPLKGELPRPYCIRIAAAKAAAVQADPDVLVATNAGYFLNFPEEYEAGMSALHQPIGAS